MTGISLTLLSSVLRRASLRAWCMLYLLLCKVKSCISGHLVLCKRGMHAMQPIEISLPHHAMPVAMPCSKALESS